MHLIRYFAFLFLISTLICCGGYNEPLDGPYELRDIGPAGGYIFYINPNADTDGWKYLEAANNNWDESLNNSDPKVEWGCIGTTCLPVSDYKPTPLFKTDSIGLGKEQTEILASHNHLSQHYAVNLIFSKENQNEKIVISGYNDWYLPSIGELELMYFNLYDQTPSLGNFSSDLYWSSSENDKNHAWYMEFGNGHICSIKKDRLNSVRLIRSF